MRPVHRANAEYRVREHLTETEIEKLLVALKGNRRGPRDWLIGLMIYRHGLRVSEACDLCWDDIDLAARTIVIRRLKGSRDSTHYLERDELAGLRRLPGFRCAASLIRRAARRRGLYCLPYPYRIHRASRMPTNGRVLLDDSSRPPRLRADRCAVRDACGEVRASDLPRGWPIPYGLGESTRAYLVGGACFDGRGVPFCGERIL